MDKPSNKADGPIRTVDDKFFSNMKNKYDTKQKDEVKVPNTTMEAILGDITQIPTKLHMTGSPGKSSVKPKKVNENPLHTGEGKDMFKSTMDEDED